MITVYIDMDGVVADFDGYAEKCLGYRNPNGKRYPEEDWYKLVADGRFYLGLNKLPWADYLISEICRLASMSKYAFDYKFLTAVPNGNDCPYSFQDKIDWVRKHWGNIDVFFGPYSQDKAIRCTSQDVLIDDRPKNIEEWNNAGGKGIHFIDDAEGTIKKLQEHLNDFPGV